MKRTESKIYRVSKEIEGYIAFLFYIILFSGMCECLDTGVYEDAIAVKFCVPA